MLTKPTPPETQQEVVRRAFDEFDVEPTTETADGAINGGPTRLCCICTVYDVSVDNFQPHHETHVAATQRACLGNGTKPLYDNMVTLDDTDHPLAIVSNNQYATIEHILDAFDISDRFGVAHGRGPTAEGARVKKPDPHYIERTMGELNVDSALYVDDSNVDVVTADRAGTDSAFTRRPHHDGYRLAAEPIYELDSLDKLLAVY